MAEPTPQEQSILDRLMGGAYRAVSPGTNLVELLREVYRRQGTPTPARPAAPAAPAASVAPTQGPAASPPRTGGTPTVTPGAASTPAPAAESSAPAEPSLLETLRQSIREQATPTNSAADRLAAFGAGMLSNTRSRGGFFGDLAAGIQAQQQFDAARRAERRQAAEAEMRFVEADRKAMLDKAKFAAEAPEREARANYYNAFADLRRRSPGAGAGGGAGQLTEARLATLRAQALNRLLSDLAKDPTNIGLSQQDLLAKAQPLVPQMMTTILNEEGAGVTPAPTQPAVPMLNPAGRPTQ